MVSKAAGEFGEGDPDAIVGGRPVAEVVRDLGVNDGWPRSADIDCGAG
ncbi:hypothetical protein [Mycobacterium sp.]|nr:hypothetical protein [Mycobacterium sp.]